MMTIDNVDYMEFISQQKIPKYEFVGTLQQVREAFDIPDCWWRDVIDIAVNQILQRHHYQVSVITFSKKGIYYFQLSY